MSLKVNCLVMKRNSGPCVLFTMRGSESGKLRLKSVAIAEVNIVYFNHSDNGNNYICYKHIFKDLKMFHNFFSPVFHFRHAERQHAK